VGPAAASAPVRQRGSRVKIVVCIKRVPDSAARLRVDSSGVKIDPEGVKYAASPYDEYALELALQLRGPDGEGNVTVVTLGEPAAHDVCSPALATGADSGLLLLGDDGADGLSTAKALAAEVADLGADLVLFGVRAIDGDRQQVGPMVATLLGRPCVTGVSTIERVGDRVLCRREAEGGTELIEAVLPAVVTATKGPAEPRLPSLKGIMAAKRKPLEEKPVEVGAQRVRVQALAEPAVRPAGRIVGEGPEAAAELVRLLRHEAKVI